MVKRVLHLLSVQENTAIFGVELPDIVSYPDCGLIDEGIMLLSKGSSARFVIPSQLGYGAQGAGGAIPPNSSLIFDVELIDC